MWCSNHALLCDNGPSYVAGELAEYLAERNKAAKFLERFSKRQFANKLFDHKFIAPSVATVEPTVANPEEIQLSSPDSHAEEQTPRLTQLKLSKGGRSILCLY